ncbi:ion channel [Isoptericola sp. NPDC057391]
MEELLVGFGDIVPTTPWLRLATTPLQALIGFALLTAAVSWTRRPTRP